MRCQHTIDLWRGMSDARWRESDEYRRRIRRAVRAAMITLGTRKRDDDEQ